MRVMRYLLMLLVVGSCGASADDYPQWLGPRRDGIYREPGVIASWPKEGPKVLWRTECGGGYSGVAVSGGKVFLTDRLLKQGVAGPKNAFDRAALPGVERVRCLDQGSGRELWKVEYAVDYTLSYAAGPRATPLIDGGKVYTLGAEGDLYCIDIKDGKVAWNRRLEGPTPIWGFAGHPLVDGERLIVLTSGKKALMTALDKRSGEVIWEALAAKDPGYCPPMIHNVGGKRHLVAWWPEGVAGLEPETGKVIWQVKHGPVKNGVSIVPPLLVGDILMVTSAHEGMLGLRVKAEGAPEKVYHIVRKGRVTTTIHGLMNPMSLHEGKVLGTSLNGEFRCVEPMTGVMDWETTIPTTGERGPINWYSAFLTPWQPEEGKPARQFFIANEDGEVIIAKINPTGYQEVSRAKILEPVNKDAGRPVVWVHPAYAGGSLLWRNDREVVCVRIGEREARSE